MTSERLGDAPSQNAEREPNRDSDAIDPNSQSANAPTQSPWWTAPAGRPVEIPAFGRTGFIPAFGRTFGRTWIEVLLDLLTPKPVLVPVKVKTRGTRRRG